ncbi:hypothetical protein L6R52_37640 [Myxococcota bacterium]|nr:hypothetical protein [Myxococcota bacterium]
MGALHTLVAAHPATSDGLRQTFGQLRAVLVNELAVARPAQLGAANYWPVAAALVERFAKTELAEHTLALLTDLLPVLRQNGAAAAAFAAIDAALPGPELARALATALAETSPHRLAGLPGLTDALDGLEALSEHAAMQALFALAPTLRTAQPASAASIVTHVLELAKLGGRDDQLGVLRDFAARETGVFDALVRYNLQAREPARRPEVARAIALASSGAKLEVNTVNALGSLVRSLEASFPQVKVEQLAAASDGGVFTLVDPAVRYRHPVQQLFDQLAPTIGRAGVQNLGPDTQNDGARLALRLTAVIANLDGEYAIPLQRIRADLDAAFRDPGKLRLPPNVDALAMRAFAQAPSVSAYVAAVPELPLELALTAGLHLAPEQLAWVSEKMAAVAGRDTKRALRDLVFACVTHGRLDLLEAARTTKAPTKAVSKLVSFVAKSYRENRMHEVQFDALIAGLKRDEDPIAAIEKAKIDETLAKLNLAELAGPNAKLDPAGLAEIAKSGEALTYLFQNYRQGYVYDGIDHGPLEGVLKDVLRSVATGTWPRSRYETEGGRQMLARLTPEQQALWKQEQVTPLKDAGNAAEQAELTDAMSLLRGLAKALTMEVKLDVPGLGALAWDAASLAKVEAHYAAEVAKIRDVPKGTPEHKARSSALGATREALVLLRLHAAVSGRQGDAKTVLLAIKEPLAEAASALRKRGLKGAAEAATRIGFVARDVKTSPRQGTYATDEDGLHALLTTCTGGCIHYTNVRRWALASLAANANERILRVYEGDRFVGRAILKFYGVKMDGYEGPALWINQYNVNGGGATPEHQKLLAKHALLKAKAMGIPVLSSYCDMTAAARDLGVAVVQKQASLQIDDGVTGLQFLDYLLRAPGNGGYAYETKKLRGAAPHFEAAPLNVNVVMPA